MTHSIPPVELSDEGGRHRQFRLDLVAVMLDRLLGQDQGLFLAERCERMRRTPLVLKLVPSALGFAIDRNALRPGSPQFSPSAKAARKAVARAWTSSLAKSQWMVD